MARQDKSSPALPLLSWPQQREIDALEMERAELVARIAKLPRHSHRRIELQARLRDLTSRELELENRMGSK